MTDVLTDEERERTGDPVMDPHVLEIWDRMREKLDQGYPDGWRFNAETPEIIGVFRRLEEGYTRQYGACPIMILAELRSKTEWSVWLFHAVLRNQLARMKPEPGEVVAVRWLGKRKPESGGNEYDDYRVVVNRGQAGAVDWSKIGDAAEAPADDDAPFGDRSEYADVDDVPF